MVEIADDGNIRSSDQTANNERCAADRVAYRGNYARLPYGGRRASSCLLFFSTWLLSSLIVHVLANTNGGSAGLLLIFNMSDRHQ